MQSDPLSLASGILQGSVYGPLPFSIFIDNLLPSLPDGTCLAYADDVMLISTSKPLEDVACQLHSLLNTASDWAKRNLLTFSYSKYNVMFIPASPYATSATSKNLMLGGKILATIDHVTVLGVVICSDLS